MEDKVLAVVEGKEIKESQLDLLIEQAPEDQKSSFRTHEGRRQLLNEMIGQELFYQKGLQENVMETEEYKRELEEVKEKFTKSYMISQFMLSIDIKDEELRKFYDAHPKQFIAPDSVRASHILLPTEQQAIDIIGEIKEGGKTFEEAAKAYSVCPSKDKGGDLNYFQRGKMVPEFENAAFSMEVGEMTDKPVKTEFGYHIIKVTDKKFGETIPFDVVKGSLKKYLLGQKQNRAYLNKIEELKKEFNVEIKAGL